DSAAAAPAAAAAMPRSFAATASIPHAASPAAADDVAAVARRTPRGNEIQRASAPPVRTSAVDSSSLSSPPPLGHREKRWVRRAIAVSIWAPSQVPTPPRATSFVTARVVVPRSQSSELRSFLLTVRSRSAIYGPCDASDLQSNSHTAASRLHPPLPETSSTRHPPDSTRDRRHSREAFGEKYSTGLRRAAGHGT